MKNDGFVVERRLRNLERDIAFDYNTLIYKNCDGVSSTENTFITEFTVLKKCRVAFELRLESLRQNRFTVKLDNVIKCAYNTVIGQNTFNFTAVCGVGVHTIEIFTEDLNSGFNLKIFGAVKDEKRQSELSVIKFSDKTVFTHFNAFKNTCALYVYDGNLVQVTEITNVKSAALTKCHGEEKVNLGVVESDGKFRIYTYDLSNNSLSEPFIITSGVSMISGVDFESCGGFFLLTGSAVKSVKVYGAGLYTIEETVLTEVCAISSSPMCKSALIVIGYDKVATLCVL